MPRPAEATNACLQPPAPRPRPAPPLLPTGGPFCTVCNLQHSLLAAARTAPRAQSSSAYGSAGLHQTPAEALTGASPPLLSRHVQACALSTRSRVCQMSCLSEAGEDEVGLDPAPPPASRCCLGPLNPAPGPSVQAAGRRCPQALSFFFFFLFDEPKEGLGIGDVIMVTQPGRRRES